MWSHSGALPFSVTDLTMTAVPGALDGAGGTNGLVVAVVESNSNRRFYSFFFSNLHDIRVHLFV